MSFEAIRAAVVTRLETAWPSLNPNVPIEWDNRDSLNKADETRPWICCEIKFGKTLPLHLDSTKGERFHGAIVISAGVRLGEGTATPLKLLGDLAGLYSNKTFSGVVCWAGEVLPEVKYAGWYMVPIRFGFRYDVLT